MIIQGQISSNSAVGVEGSKLVLLVEDEALVAMVAEESLRDLGFEPIIATTAAAAMRALEVGPIPVLAIIDVGLPDERGDKLALRMRDFAPDMKIIMASGYDEHELRARFATDPSMGVLAKPYTEADLAQTARDLGLSIPNG